MRTSVCFTLFALAIMLVAAGCSENVVRPDEATGELNLTDEFGGYTAESEAPAFGDEELIESEGEEVEIDDPLAASPAVTVLTDDPESGQFHFRAVWGQLRCDTSITEPTDWSGSLTISKGAVLIRRTIRFELAQDYILPRVDRTLLEWHSITTIHNDGLVADLLVPPPVPVLDSTAVVNDADTTWVVDTLWPDAVVVEFNTGPYSRTFTLGELASLDTVITLEDSSQIAFTAYQKYRCPRGVVVGHWGQNEQGQGTVRARWMEQNGQAAGWLEGHYGIDENGNHLFYGKWIDENGDFEGFLRGQWSPHPSADASENGQRHGAGSVEGKIYADNGAEIGAFRGRYKSAAMYQQGFFQARWKLYCPYDSERGTGWGTPLEDNM